MTVHSQPKNRTNDEQKSTVSTNDETSAPNAVGEMEQHLATLQTQVDEHLEKWQRTAAEFANYKKRQERDRIQFMKYANSGLITRLLPVLDDLQRALATTPEHLNDHSWVEGISLIERKLWNTLQQEGAIMIEAGPGKPFDPALHEALTWEESDAVAEGHIIEQIQPGYKLHDRVLRPALVRVAKTISRPAEEEEKSEEQSSQGEQ
ncbi:MAG: nucleotide exchange factor GrpE [Chloroflexi bacterium]|nr:nucleotide exchange factor GrpE [Chloroflexota bacterium]